MSKNIYKTAQGQTLDIDNLRLANENTIAVGNMRVNARGDQVASDGTVTVPKETIMKNHYRLNTPWITKKKTPTLAEEVIATAPKPSAPAPKVETSNLVSDTGLRGSLASALSKTAVIPEEDDFTLDEEPEVTQPANTLKRI